MSDGKSATRPTKAVLLAAGKGERLQALSLDMPKPLLPVRGKPAIEWNIELCRRHGITDLFVNLHHKGEAISRHLGDGSRYGVNITYAYEPNLLGTAGGVKQFSAQLSGEPFFIIYADNVSDYHLGEMLDRHRAADADITIALFHKTEVQNSGVAIFDSNGWIQEFVEKPAESPPPSHWVNAAIYVMEPRLLPKIPDGPCDFGHDVFPIWIDAGVHVLGVTMAHGIITIDTPELFSQAQNPEGE